MDNSNRGIVTMALHLYVYYNAKQTVAYIMLTTSILYIIIQVQTQVYNVPRFLGICVLYRKGTERVQCTEREVHFL